MKSFFLNVAFIGGIAFQAVSGTLQGVIQYAGLESKGMRAVKILVLNDSLTGVDSTWSDANGHFTIPDLPAGTYQVRVYPNHPWGGVNSTDAFLVLKHFVQISALSGLALLAADVDQSSDINSLDALLIARRFTGQITGFPAGDWIKQLIPIQIAQSDTLEVSIGILCMGDTDQSHTPNNDQFLICSDSLTDPRDGKKYGTVQIGTQCWMTQNLNLGTMIPGTGDQANNGIIEKYCYDNLEINCTTYGALYQWTEMMQYTSVQKAQGICPGNFHIPSDGEWSVLVTFLGGDSVAGGKLKETGFLYWNSPNTGASNETGFSALGAGNRIGSGTFLNYNTESKIWSSTYHNTNSAWFRNLYNTNPWIFQNNHGKNNGLSVRCLKN